MNTANKVLSGVFSLKVLMSCSNCLRLLLSSVALSGDASSSERPTASVKRAWRGFLVGRVWGSGPDGGLGWDVVGL